MGANVMMRIAGEMKSDFPLKAMVAVNNPFDIWLTIQLMRGKIYEKHLANELKRSLVVRNPVTDSEKAVYKEMIKKFNLDYEKIKKLETWRDFDEEFTIKVHPQFKSAC